jgi:hypothetical protein
VYAEAGARAALVRGRRGVEQQQAPAFLAANAPRSLFLIIFANFPKHSGNSVDTLQYTVWVPRKAPVACKNTKE